MKLILCLLALTQTASALEVPRFTKAREGRPATPILQVADPGGAAPADTWIEDFSRRLQEGIPGSQVTPNRRPQVSCPCFEVLVRCPNGPAQAFFIGSYLQGEARERRLREIEEAAKRLCNPPTS